MVFDEIYVKDGTQLLPIDSIENQPIEEIIYEGQVCHFAKQKDLTGTSEIVADNGVDEPIISLGVTGNTVQVLLPTEYQQVEYIESTGTQYIDTGIKGASNVKLQFKGAFARVSGYSHLTGSRNGGVGVGNSNILCVFANTDNFDYQYHKTSYKIYDTTTTKVAIEISKDGVFFNNTLQYSVSQEDWSNNYNITIFAVNTAGTISYGKNHKMYSYKLYVDNILVRDFIPCYRKSDNVIGMYDLVNNVFYTNSGTGTFKKGANASPTPEAPIPIENANDNGMSVAVHGTNLATAQQVCKGFASYKEVEYEGRQCVSFKQNNSKKFVLEGGFKPKTQYTISFENTSVGTNSTSCMCVFYEEIGASYNRDVILVGTNWQRRVFTTLAGYTVKSIGLYNVDYRRTIYIDVNTFMLQEGAITDPVYEPYFRETINIPTSITLNGKNVPLLFSKYDKLTVDRVNNEVIYTEGSYTRVYEGTEHFYQNAWAENSGYGRYLCDSANLPVINSGLCSHFLRRNWVPSASSKNVYVVANMDNGYYRLFFKTDGSIEDTFANSANEFKAFLKQQYDEGNPVTVIAQRKTPVEHDITNTDLGQSLLALATGKGTNYLEITGDLAPSQTDLSYWEQIVPETT